MGYLIYSGLVASIWIICGVLIAAKFYPNYNHNKQFCSELGAKGSPTEKLSPLINNYPLGILFCLFGFAIMYTHTDNVLMAIIGLLIITHGVGTWVAGYYPMDKDAYTKSPSFDCKVHSWAGFIMLLTLLIAPLLVLFITTIEAITFNFKAFSLLNVFITLYFLLKLTKAYKQNTNAGLYQRLSYAIQLIWLSSLSIILAH